MARERAKIVGLAAIDRAIKTLDGIAGSLNERVQEVAVAIVEHGAGAGNGDMSRALPLVQLARKHRLNVAFLGAWFAYFGNCNVNLRGNDGKGKVSLISKDSKRFRGFDVAGARANNWFDAVNDDGERAAWYEGPEPAEYQPETIGDIASRITNFTKGLNDRLKGTKTVKGKEVPLVQLNAADEEQLHAALAFMERIAATLARHEEVQALAAKLEQVTAEAGQDKEVLEVLGAPMPEQAVA
jgi:hypothetical protein